MRTTIFLSTLYLVFAFFACNRSDNGYDNLPNWTNRIVQLNEHNSKKVSIREGFAGTLTLRDGDCMPVVGSTCREYPVSRRIRIYEATSISESHNAGGGFYDSVDSKLIATIKTDQEGFFQYTVVPGTYSIFIEENGKLYANSSNSSVINAVIVDAGKVGNGNVQIDDATD